MSTETRCRAVADAIRDEFDGYLVTNLVNVRYLSGFTGSNAAMLITADGHAVLATDGRYGTQATAECPDVEVVVTRRVASDLVSRARTSGLTRLGIETSTVTVAQMEQLRSASDGAVDLVDGSSVVETLRTVKDDDEITSLRTACNVTDEAFTAVLGELRPGVRERDIDWALRRAMHERGAVPAFDSIVAFGPNSAEPHHDPGDRELQVGDFVKLDFGACVGGYHADMTRTVCLGTAADWQRDLHALVETIQSNSRGEVRVGAVPVELDTASRSRIEAAGYDVAHGLGHGVGLEIHEAPFLVPDSPAARLVDRVAVTVEPGIYLPGRGGVRIEDTVLVHGEAAEPLTASPRELIEI